MPDKTTDNTDRKVNNKLDVASDEKTKPWPIGEK